MNYKKLGTLSAFFVILPFLTMWLAGLALIQYPEIYYQLSNFLGLAFADFLVGALTSKYFFVVSETAGLVFALIALASFRGKAEPHVGIKRLLWGVLLVLSLLTAIALLSGMIMRIFYPV